jgi:phosphate transport system permease protein
MAEGPFTALATGVRMPSITGRKPRRPGDVSAFDRIADVLLKALCTVAALLALVVIVEIVYQLVSGARPAISAFGLGFLVHEIWEPNFEKLGALTFLYGTAVTCLGAMLLAVPLGISIALYLSTVATGRVRAVVGPLVEMLAAIPSVILGFWGLVVLAPFLSKRVEPFLHETFGFLPIFGAPSTTGLGIFTAILILAIMVLPIVASISRDLLLSVPHELRDGATALGSTRWEVVRGVMLPSAASGIVAASFLGLGRALGEAIATFQVLGGGNYIHVSLFDTGGTLASKIAQEVFGAPFRLQHASLFYLGLVLLVIELGANFGSRAIVRRFDVYRAVG